LVIFQVISTPMDVVNKNRTGAARAGSAPLRIAVVSSFSRSLTNFRLELLKRLKEEGHEVTAFGPENDTLVIETLAQIGVAFVQIPMSRTGTNPLADVMTLFAFVRHFRKLRPDIVLPYTMKPIIYGGIAARLTGVPRYHALVTGLGHVFADPSPRGREAIVRRISVWLYRIALKHAGRVFVYNDADDQDIRRYSLIQDMSRIVCVPGSGVDLAYYRQAKPPAGPPVFILIARLLRDKGIYEFVEASRQLRKRHPGIRSHLLGQLEPHESGVKPAELREWAEEGVVNYLGEVRDVRPYLTESSVFVLPSYYREGIPRSILEAMAMGRPIITTDLPGCRDTVLEGENGFVVPPRDSRALARAMEHFVVEPELACQMGERSRQLASQRFDVHAVNRLLLREIGLA
jgi:glycosyltransferase involved in cell wall biosynthesis